MKNLIAFLLVFNCLVKASAQKIDSATVEKLTPAAREEVNRYLTEAKKASKTGKILAFGGASVALVGAIVYTVGFYDDLNDDLIPEGENSTEKTGAAIMYTGGAIALVSIPFFIKVHKKREAARAVIYSDHGVSQATGIVFPGTKSAGIRFVFPLAK